MTISNLLLKIFVRILKTLNCVSVVIVDLVKESQNETNLVEESQNETNLVEESQNETDWIK